MRRATLGTALLAFALVWTVSAAAPAQTAPAPQAAATTLPEIGRTHSRGLCTTVRDSVAPIVLGLMKSDELVGAGRRAFLKMGNDQRTGSREAIDLDQVYARHAVDAMVHNLAVVDKLLADAKRFPKTAATDDEHIAQDLKAQIQAVAERQRAALNTIANALDAEDLGRMQNDLPGGIASSTKPASVPAGALVNGARGPDVDGSFIGVSGLIMPQNSTPPPLARGTSNTMGHTVWDRLASAMELHQTAIAGAEQRLTPTVVAISIACRAELSPVPTATP